MMMRATLGISRPGEIEGTAEDEEEAEVEDVANYLVMDLAQEAWIEISTKDQWVAAQKQDIEDLAKSGAQDLTLMVLLAGMISM